MRKLSVVLGTKLSVDGDQGSGSHAEWVGKIDHTRVATLTLREGRPESCFCCSVETPELLHSPHEMGGE